MAAIEFQIALWREERAAFWEANEERSDAAAENFATSRAAAVASLAASRSLL